MGNRNVIPLLIGIFLCLVTVVQAQQVGDPAPDFALETLAADTIRLSDYRGQVVYLFFFGFN